MNHKLTNRVKKTLEAFKLCHGPAYPTYLGISDVYYCWSIYDAESYAEHVRFIHLYDDRCVTAEIIDDIRIGMRKQPRIERISKLWGWRLIKHYESQD